MFNKPMAQVSTLLEFVNSFINDYTVLINSNKEDKARILIALENQADHLKGRIDLIVKECYEELKF